MSKRKGRRKSFSREQRHVDMAVRPDRRASETPAGYIGPTEREAAEIGPWEGDEYICDVGDVTGLDPDDAAVMSPEVAG